VKHQFGATDDIRTAQHRLLGEFIPSPTSAAHRQEAADADLTNHQSR
jgi:hypothetical protein